MLRGNLESHGHHLKLNFEINVHGGLGLSKSLTNQPLQLEAMFVYADLKVQTALNKKKNRVPSYFSYKLLTHLEN